MSKLESESPPVLQAPGRGLPKFELFMGRLIVNWKLRRTSRAEAAAQFDLQKREILSLVADTDPALAAKRVLIKRLRGLEDSSRFWSVYMTLDHLSIVNQEMSNLISLLARGETPKVVVSTAAVKPSDSADVLSVNKFAEVCNRFQDTVAVIPNLKTTITWAHPWFGELNAESWHFFAAFHMELHRRQIMSIRRKLPNLE